MNTKQNSPSIDEREVLEWLDALSAGGDRVRAAKALARLGVWARGSTLPRGTVWAAATNALPQPDRIGVLVSALTDDSDRDVQAQSASAIGEWSGEEAVTPLTEQLRASADQGVREHIVAALGTVGGPSAIRALLSALNAMRSASEALSILDAVQDLLIGGRADETDVQISIVEPPRELEQTFDAVLDEIRTVLEQFDRAAESNPAFESARLRARELLEVLGRGRESADDAGFSDDRLHLLLAEIEAGADSHPREEEVVAYAMNDVDETMRPPIKAHIDICLQCRDDVARTRDFLRSVSDRPTVVRFPQASAPLTPTVATGAEVAVSESKAAAHEAEHATALIDVGIGAPSQGENDYIKWTLTHHPGGVVEVCVYAKDDAYRGGSARLEFLKSGEPVEFKTVVGEPVVTTIPLNLAKGEIYGQWMALVTIPPGTALRVVPFPRECDGGAS